MKAEFRQGEFTKDTMSASKLDALRQCPRMYYYQYEMKIERAREEGARRFGTMFHAGLEAWWRSLGAPSDVPWDNEPERALAESLAAIDADARHVDTDPFEVAKARALMTVYHHRYVEDTSFESIAVEEFFRVPIRWADGTTVWEREWSLVGKKDAMVKWKRDRVAIVEHKHTTSDIGPGEPYWQRLTINTQLSIYFDAARQLGFDAQEAIYDVVRAPKLEPKKATPEDRRMTAGTKCSLCGGEGKRKVDGSTCAKCGGDGWHRTKDGVVKEPQLRADARLKDETPDEYAARVVEAVAEEPDKYMRRATLTRSKEEISACRADVIAAIDDIVRYRHARYFPRSTASCLNVYGRRCDYLEICSGEASPDDKLYRIRNRK